MWGIGGVYVCRVSILLQRYILGMVLRGKSFGILLLEIGVFIDENSLVVNGCFLVGFEMFLCCLRKVCMFFSYIVPKLYLLWKFYS